MPRIAFVGAGSTVFTRNLIGDVLAQPELAGSTFALMDIDPRRLDRSPRSTSPSTCRGSSRPIGRS